MSVSGRFYDPRVIWSIKRGAAREAEEADRSGLQKRRKIVINPSEKERGLPVVNACLVRESTKKMMMS